MIHIETVDDGPRLDEVRLLFEEYAVSLAIDLSFQDFARELSTLPGAYAPPRGILLLALIDGAAAGCVAVRPIDDTRCEMKRLHVRPAFQRLGCGRQLAERAMAYAREAGYQAIVLDTLPSMIDAQRLYERLGFTDVPAYRFNPIAGTRFLARALNSNSEPKTEN